ncbi:Hypothetical protein LUCI_5143 [Lucifera butyrica]|uniref:Uncharacterized protein n=1 Tax=Lucifera butyrica TaxID=1351585 RepID=A0A498RFQ3_9FIRM|nr:hypothetical protein [Lucifera butyrica]VBB09845.1 Hypothetical protein LUCI_5143 [Lucifera butyrica]
MSIKTGMEIVALHHDYLDKIEELEKALAQLREYNYTSSVIETQLGKLRVEIKALEETRFQPLDPVVIPKTLLGAKQK